MKAISIGLALSLIHTIAFAGSEIAPEDDIVCHGGALNGNEVYIRTENTNAGKKLLLLICDGHCVQPPYLFEASYDITSFQFLPHNGMINERRYFLVDTQVISDEDKPAYPSVIVDTLYENLAATMTMTVPDAMGGDKKSTTEISLPYCEIIVGGNGPSHNK